MQAHAHQKRGVQLPKSIFAPFFGGKNAMRDGLRVGYQEDAGTCSEISLPQVLQFTRDVAPSPLI